MATKEYNRQYFLTHKIEINNNRRSRDKRVRAKLNEVERNYIDTSAGKLWNRRKTIHKKYGITYETYLQIEKEQSNLCAICGAAPVEDKYLDIDHNHKTMKVRGLLCRQCNHRVRILESGWIVEWLLPTLTYLREFGEMPDWYLELEREILNKRV